MFGTVATPANSGGTSLRDSALQPASAMAAPKTCRRRTQASDGALAGRMLIGTALAVAVTVAVALRSEIPCEMRSLCLSSGHRGVQKEPIKQYGLSPPRR